MVTVSLELFFKNIREYDMVKRAIEILENDPRVQEMLRQANIMMVHRMKYNEHGLRHARVVTGAAIELFKILRAKKVEFDTLRDGVLESEEEVATVIAIASYLHDIGNAIYRKNHSLFSVILAKPIVEYVLDQVCGNKIIATRMMTEILHCIYSHDDEIPCLTMEASVVKTADGLDVAEDRALIPYKLGKADIHAISALMIKKVDVSPGSTKLIRVTVDIVDYASLFQVEQIMLKKIRTTLLANEVEVYANLNGNLMKIT